MAYVGIPIALLTMYLAQRVERRLGPVAAGWFAALPIAFAVAGATVAITGSSTDASLVALSAVGHVGPMVAYAIAFVMAATRLGAVRGLALAMGVYVAASIVVIPAPDVVRLVIGVLAIIVGTLYMARQPRAIHTGQAASTTQQVLSLASAGLVVGLITVANRYSGPNLAGTVGAFPTMTTTIALFLTYRVRVRNANSVMSGLVRSLPIYMVYCVSFAYLVVRMATL